MKSVFLKKRFFHQGIFLVVVKPIGLHIGWTLVLWLKNITKAQRYTWSMANTQVRIGQKGALLGGPNRIKPTLVSKYISSTTGTIDCLTGLGLMPRCLSSGLYFCKCLELIYSKTWKYKRHLPNKHSESWISNYLFLRGP